MDGSTHIGCSAALMAPVCFVIRSSVVGRVVVLVGGGGSKETRPCKRKRTDIQIERWTPSKERKKENKKR